MGVTVTKIDVVLDTEQEKKREADVDVENYIDENGVPRTKPKPCPPLFDMWMEGVGAPTAMTFCA